MRRAAPAGVDAVLDFVGPETFAASFAMLRRRGTLFWCGMLIGREVTVHVPATYLNHLSIRDLYLGSIRETSEIAGHLAAGRIAHPRSTRHPIPSQEEPEEDRTGQEAAAVRPPGDPPDVG